MGGGIATAGGDFGSGDGNAGWFLQFFNKNNAFYAYFTKIVILKQ